MVNQSNILRCRNESRLKRGEICQFYKSLPKTLSPASRKKTLISQFPEFQPSTLFKICGIKNIAPARTATSQSPYDIDSILDFWYSLKGDKREKANELVKKFPKESISFLSKVINWNSLRNWVGTEKEIAKRKQKRDELNEQYRKKSKTIIKSSREKLGGKCSECGYSKCQEALHFHHIDPSSKKFAISSVRASISEKELEEELNKCKLLCANCHTEEHYKMSDLT